MYEAGNGAGLLLLHTKGQAEWNQVILDSSGPTTRQGQTPYGKILQLGSGGTGTSTYCLQVDKEHLAWLPQEGALPCGLE